MNNLNNIASNENIPLKQIYSMLKPSSDSTSSSLNDENQKNFSENNNYKNYNLNNNQNIKNIKSINMEQLNINDINEDIFPKERLGGNLNYISNERNSYSIIKINNKLNSNSLDNIFLKNKEIIMKEDIPEMILYKYNYVYNYYKESLNDIEYETQWLYDFLKTEKTIKECEEKRIEIKKCIKNLLIEHKAKKCDTPLIVLKSQNLYNKYFTQSQVFDLLTIYDVEFLRLQKKRKRIMNIFNYIIKDEESILRTKINNYFKKDYILEAKNESELDLIETQLVILTYVYQSVEIDENYKKLINYEILSNSNIDFTLLNKIKESKLSDILKKFCLTPEQVVHNLKVLTGELNSELIEPPLTNCSLGELCQEKISETSGKYLSPKEVLKLSLEYYILLLSSHPYIFKFIYDKLFKICTLSTNPTEKGKEILNSLHPSYHCKRIDNIKISSFFEEKNENICNIYTNEFGDLYLDIEKCVNNGLIKCDINFGINLYGNSFEIEQLISLLSKAINGKKNDNLEDKNPQVKKNNGARNLAVRNMITYKNFAQGFFLNYIKKELHKYSEKYIIKMISNDFFNLISRNYLDKIQFEDNTYIISIIYNNQKKYFKCLCIDSNFRIKKELKFEYLWRNEKISEASLNATLFLSQEVSKFKTLIEISEPKAIIIDVSNLECYKMINYIRNRFRDCNIVYCDYISKIYKLKLIEINDESENKQGIDQVKYIINPVNQILELWNYKYEDNLLLNITFHPLQESIKDIALFNYSLESQIIRVVNSKGIILSNLKKYSYNLFNFICGFGPSTFYHIINNLNNPKMIKNSLINNNPILFRNISPFIIEYNKLGRLYNLKNNENKFELIKLEVFYSMIKDSIYFKKNCLCNAIVSNIDIKKQIINCILLRDTNSIRAILKFCNVDLNIQDYHKFFYPQRIILCKIIDIKLKHNSYEIFLSNKNEDLISVKDYWTENLKYSKIFEKFTINEEEDFIIKDIKRLKEIQEYDHNKESKLLKYSLINMENEQFLTNLNYNNIKVFLKVYKNADYVDYRIRPSFLGENHLILTFKLIEDIYLNFDIEIIKIELDNYNENNEKSFAIHYKIENNYYKSLNELVDIFALKMSKRIKEFKKNDYFRSPSGIRNLLYQIFKIKSNIIEKKAKNENKMDLEYNNDDIIRMNDIAIGFMKESPEYGIFFTKSNYEYNYTIDFIKILFNGYLFHGKIFNSLHDLINFYKDIHNTNHYQNFIKRQFICNIHSQIEDIDEQYTEFDGPDPNLIKFENNYIKTNEMKELKENLLIQNPQINNSFNNDFIGKKRKSENNFNNGWDNINPNIDNNIGEMNDINENDDWANENQNNNNININNSFNSSKNRNDNKKKKKYDENNNNNNNSWNSNNNNYNDNKNSVWGKSNSNNSMNDWNNASSANNTWDKPTNKNNNKNSLNNINNSKNNNNIMNNNINYENSAWDNSNPDNTWDNSKINDNINNINNNDYGNSNNNDDWANSNINDSFNNSNNNKKSFNKPNKKDRKNNFKENINNNNDTKFSWANPNNTVESNFNWGSSDNSNYNWDNNNKSNDNYNNNNNNNSKSNSDGWGSQKSIDSYENWVSANNNSNKNQNNSNNNYNNNFNKKNDFKQNKNNSWRNNSTNDNNNFSHKKNNFNNNNNNNKNNFNNKNKNYGNNKNNNKFWNKSQNNNNNTNQSASFLGWNKPALNTDDKKYDNNNNNSNYNDYNYNRDPDDWVNMKSDFKDNSWNNYDKNQKYNQNKKKTKKKVGWAEIGDKYDGSQDIKQENDEGVIDFENKDEFGGYSFKTDDKQ